MRSSMGRIVIAAASIAAIATRSVSMAPAAVHVRTLASPPCVAGREIRLLETARSRHRGGLRSAGRP
jgi:hypothetical protein